MGGLFGGGGGGSTSTDVRTLSTLDPNQQALMSYLSGIVHSNLNKGVPSYPGTYTPGATAGQSLSYKMLEDMLGGENGVFQTSPTDIYEQMAAPFDPTSAKNYWETAVKKPAMESWEKEILPSVLEPFAGWDATDSGAARRAVAEAGAGMNTDINAKLADILFQAENAQKTRQLSAMEYPAKMLTTTLPVALSERDILSQQEQEKYQDWMYEQSYNNPWLKFIMPLLNVNSVDNLVTQTQKGGGSGLSGLGSLIGGLGSLVGGVAGFF